MGETTVKAARGIAKSVQWGAVCKDCQKLRKPAIFAYPDAWIEGVVNRGGSRSDRCPICRKKHARDARSFAAPYVDIDTIGQVADPQSPTGPLGGLGPLPTKHERSEKQSDLGKYDFGLEDADISRLLQGLENKQVAVVVAGTGTGKSTFLPYRLLVPPDDACRRLADRGPIIVTEPRRLAATDTARFVAEKLHRSSVGAGSDIGYRVQDEPAFDASCRLIYVTDGSLINWLRDGSFRRFGAIMVDEAHERSKNIDIILGLLRESLPRHPHLKLIVASATIDAQFFVDYFGGQDRVYRLDAPAKKLWGYGDPLWPGGPIDLSHQDWVDKESGAPRHGPRAHGENEAPWASPFGPHETNLQDITKRLLDLRIVEKAIEPGTNAANWRQQMPTLVAKQVLAILKGTRTGDILAFLPGKKPIDDALTLIQADAPSNVDVFPLLRTTPPDIQAKAKGEKKDSSRRRVVVSTNIAETSLTIDGITFVVDSGLINQSQWDTATATKRIPATLHSQDGVRQRWGRVGRKAPGWVFPLYTKEQYKQILPPHTPPESTRDDLEQFVLTAKAAGVDTPDTFIWPSSFKRDAVEETTSDKAYRAAFHSELERASSALRVRGAIDRDGDLTAAGYELQAFSGSMAHAMALALGDRMTCAVEVAVALLLLSNRQIVGNLQQFDRHWEAAKRNQARRIHEGMRAGCRDELELVLKVYAAWEAQPQSQRQAWADNHLVNHQELAQVETARRTLLEPLSPGRKSDEIRPVLPELAPRARLVLSRTLIDQTYYRVADGWRPVLRDDGKLTWRIDRLAYCTDADRVIAFQRRVGRDSCVYMSNLVQVSEPVDDIHGGWVQLALATARHLRNPSGRVLGPTLLDHLIHTREWRIGERYFCEVEPGEADVRLRAAQRLGRAPKPVDGGAAGVVAGEKPDTEEVRAIEAEVEAIGISISATTPAIADSDPGETDFEPDTPDVASELTLIDIVEEDQGADAKDLVSSAPQGETDPTQDTMFVNIEDWEAPDDDVDPLGIPGASSNERVKRDAGFANAPLPVSSPRAITPDGSALPVGFAEVLIVGYQGLGDDRTLVVVPYHSDYPAGASKPNRLRSGAEVTVRAVEAVNSWGDPFLVTIEETTGIEIVLEQADLTFDPFDRAIVEAIPTGSRLRVTLRALDRTRMLFAASLLKSVHQSLASLSQVPNGDRSMYPARVIGLIPNGRFAYVDLALELSDTVVLHRYSVRKKLLDEAGIPAVTDMGLYVELGLPGTDTEGGVVRQSFKDEKMPKGFALTLDDNMIWDSKQKILSVGPLMSIDCLEKMLDLRHTEEWHQAVTALWRASNTLEIIDVKPDPPDVSRYLARIRAQYAPGSSTLGTVEHVTNSLGVFISIEEGLSGLAYQNTIGSEGVLQPSRYYRRGQIVEATILGIDLRKRVPRIQLSMRSAEVPSKIEQLKELFPLGTQVTGIVDRIVDRLGALVRLEGDFIAQFSAAELDNERVGEYHRSCTPGQTIDAVVADVVLENGRPVVRLVPSEASQLTPAPMLEKIPVSMHTVARVEATGTAFEAWIARPYVHVELLQKGDAAAFRAARSGRLVPLIQQVVTQEGPVHQSRVMRTIAHCFSVNSLDAAVEAQLTEAVDRAVLMEHIASRGDFLWPIAMELPPVRHSGGRSVDEVAPEELAAGAKVMLENNPSLPRHALLTGLIRAFGYNPTDNHAAATLAAALDSAYGASRPGHVAAASEQDSTGVRMAEPGEATWSASEARIAQPYTQVELPRLGDSVAFRLAQSGRLVPLVQQVVAGEGPVHKNRVMRAIALSFSVNPLDAAVRTQLAAAIDRAILMERVMIRGSFLWPLGMETPPVRHSGGRSVDELAPEEIAAGAQALVDVTSSLPRPELLTALVRAFGYNSGDSHTVATFAAAVDSHLVNRMGHTPVLRPGR